MIHFVFERPFVAPRHCSALRRPRVFDRDPIDRFNDIPYSNGALCARSDSCGADDNRLTFNEPCLNWRDVSPIHLFEDSTPGGRVAIAETQHQLADRRMVVGRARCGDDARNELGQLGMPIAAHVVLVGEEGTRWRSRSERAPIIGTPPVETGRNRRDARRKSRRCHLRPGLPSGWKMGHERPVSDRAARLLLSSTRDRGRSADQPAGSLTGALVRTHPHPESI